MIFLLNMIFLSSHSDFDAAIYRSDNQELTRQLIHHFADSKQGWQECSDGQVGRNIPGLIASSIFKNNDKFETWRVER
jgi:uncharacterized protein YehS (DUF1456 family)